MMMDAGRMHKDVVILGGGPAGLAAAFYAAKKGLSFALFEAKSMIGGNAVTYQWQDFRYDSGAHRWHDKDAQSTADVKALQGNSLRLVQAPSQIFHEGKWYDFPLTPLDLLNKLGLIIFFKSGMQVLGQRLIRRNPGTDFRSKAVGTYGPELARRFLLGYTEKLWGLPPDRLSPAVSGKRLKGLDLKTFVTEAFKGKAAKTRHIDGSFYYPEQGIGQLMDALTDAAGRENIFTGSPVTAIRHDGRKVLSVTTKGHGEITADKYVNTLSPALTLRLMEPQPGEAMLDLANSLVFRNLILVSIFINRAEITPNATIYFPDEKFDFTRVTEPRNRSRKMSPEGKTSLVAEIPCQPADEIWQMEDEAIISKVRGQLIAAGLVRPEEVIAGECRRMQQAYPILEKDFMEKQEPVLAYLNKFENLSLSGRNARFEYLHIHDLMEMGRKIFE